MIDYSVTILNTGIKLTENYTERVALQLQISRLHLRVAPLPLSVIHQEKAGFMFKEDLSYSNG